MLSSLSVFPVSFFPVWETYRSYETVDIVDAVNTTFINCQLCAQYQIALGTVESYTESDILPLPSMKGQSNEIQKTYTPRNTREEHCKYIKNKMFN